MLRVVGWGRVAGLRRGEKQRYARAWEQANAIFDAL